MYSVKNLPSKVRIPNDSFVVIRLCDNEYWYYGHYANVTQASEIANELGNGILVMGKDIIELTENSYHVYIVEPSAAYTGGCAIVTARSEEEARNFMSSTPSMHSLLFRQFTVGDEIYPQVTELKGVTTEYKGCFVLAEKIHQE